MPPAVALLLDAPSAAPVAARLAGEIGGAQALRLYRVLAARTIAAAHDAGFPVTVWFRPAGARGEMQQWLGPDADLRLQASGSLGTRMAGAVAALNYPDGWLAVVRECAGIDAVLLQNAAAALADAPIVIGPCSDGGCYLIGGRIAPPDCVRAVDGASRGTLGDLRSALTGAGISWREARVLRAVESAADARAARLLT